MLCAAMRVFCARLLRRKMNTPLKKFSIRHFVPRSNSFGRALAVAFLLMTSGLAPDAKAGDAWKEKKYQDWTADDVYRIKYESPWTRRAVKDAPWIKGRVGFLSMAPTGCDGRPDLSRANQNPPEMAMGATVASVEYRVDWMSSRTMRAAKMREAILCGTMEQESADEFLDQEVEQYQIDVKSADMMPFDSMDDETIQKNTWLTFKKTQIKINPEYVGAMRMSGQKRIFSITFKFNKQSEDGKDYVLPDEKEIEFMMQADKFVLKAKFQPSKMVTKEGPDL